MNSVTFMAKTPGGKRARRQNRTEFPAAFTYISFINSKRTGFYTYRKEGVNRNRVDLIKQDKLGDRRQTGRRTMALGERHNFEQGQQGHIPKHKGSVF